ncbi:MAG: FUSC family protein [Thermoleophilaceae bacterium]
MSAIDRARARLERVDPGLFALKNAARAAIVMPGVFAFADKVIKNPDTATFAAFGSFAILVFAEFGGSRRTRLVAYLALAAAGAILIVLGTLCSRDPWIAAAAMAVVGFAILFSGVISGYFVAGGTAAMLTFVLPVNLPASPSVIPSRLEGWGLAAAAGISASMLLWPSRPRDKLVARVAGACLALAEFMESELGPDRSRLPERERAAREAVAAVRQQFLATPYRPTGPTASAEAIAFLVDELDWIESFAFARGDGEPGLDLCRDENREVLAAAAAVLRESAASLEGGEGHPDLERLERARDAVADALKRRIAELPRSGDELELAAALDPSFRLRALSYSAGQIGSNALRATGHARAAGVEEARWYRAPALQASTSEAISTLRATERRAAERASPQSVLFRNSIRGAAALAISVFVAQKTGVQHAFWVVLGTLSVLRSNALGTGATVLSALAGTAVGIVVGAGLIIAIGSNETVVWAVLPVAVLVAAYAPRVVSFAAGQAAFTVVVLMLFNLIQPSGWKVGLVRVEDVAIGFAVSILVGLLFWPRGAVALIRSSLAAAYERSADYVVAASRRLVGAESAAPDEAAREARLAAGRLDDAFRAYLGERSTEQTDMDSVATLAAGTMRLQRTAFSLLALTRMTNGFALGEPCARSLDRQLDALRDWYTHLGEALVDGSPPPAQTNPDTAGRKRVLECAREGVAADDEDRNGSGLVLLWASQHLDNLWRLEAHLSQHAASISSSGDDRGGTLGPSRTPGMGLHGDQTPR